MEYLLGFLFAGTMCLIAEELYIHTKLTPGHIVVLYVFIGTALSFFKIYDVILEYTSMGGKSLITYFGHSLFQSSKEALLEGNFLSIFSNMLSSSGIIVYLIVLSYLLTLIFRTRP